MNEDDEDSFDIMNSYKRREYVRTTLKKLSLEKITDESLWTLMSFPPVFNSITVYGTYMHPKKGLLETRFVGGFFFGYVYA